MKCIPIYIINYIIEELSARILWQPTTERCEFLLIFNKIIAFVLNQLQKKISHFKKLAVKKFHYSTNSGKKCVKFDDFQQNNYTVTILVAKNQFKKTAYFGNQSQEHATFLGFGQNNWLFMQPI